MRVFTDEFIRSLHPRQRGRQEDDWSPLYDIATAPVRQNYRDRIELMADTVPRQLLMHLLGHMNTLDQFYSAWHELLFAYHLSLQGCQLEYEPVMDGLTPDFLAARDGRRFIAEVLTRDASEHARAQSRLMSDLMDRIHHTPGNAFLLVDFDTRKEPFTAAVVETMAADVAAWLNDRTAEPGDRRSISGVGFEVYATSASDETLRALPKVGSVFVPIDLAGVRQRIEDKLSKYRKLAAEKGLAFVVGVAVTPNKTFSFRCLDGVLTTPNGLFADPGSSPLSAVLWAEESCDLSTKMRAVHNPNAQRPLPTDLFSSSGPA